MGHLGFVSYGILMEKTSDAFSRKKLLEKIQRGLPTANQIAYNNVNWDAGESHIYIATLGEQEEERVVEGLDPAWSPNGEELAYVTYILNARRVMLIDIRTRKQKRLLPRKANSWQNSPSWSAVGDKLAFSWNTHKVPPIEAKRPVWDAWQTTETIYIVNRDGTGLKQLIEEAGPYAQYPALSPNGEEVLYTQELTGYFQVFKVHVNSHIVTAADAYCWFISSPSKCRWGLV